MKNHNDQSIKCPRQILKYSPHNPSTPSAAMHKPPSMNQVLHLKTNGHISHEYAKVRWHQFNIPSFDSTREKPLNPNAHQYTHGISHNILLCKKRGMHANNLKPIHNLVTKFSRPLPTVLPDTLEKKTPITPNKQKSPI